MVTVIIPHLPERDYLPTWDSLVRQTIDFFNIEPVIIEDVEKRGVSWAINQGFDRCETEYFFICGDDTVLREDCLERMATAAEDNPDCSFVYCNNHWGGDKIKASKWDYERLKNGNYINGVALIRTKDFCKYDEDIKRLADWDFYLSMGKAGHKGFWFDAFLYTSHRGNNGISDQDDYRYWEIKVKEKHGL